MLIRPETAQDLTAIRAITTSAFFGRIHGTGKEYLLVEALRDAGALSVSLVAEAHGKVIGHIGFSPVTINSKECGWFGLAPLSVSPEMQRQGIGRALVHEGLGALRKIGAHGCVVLGDRQYYAHFGFHPCAELRLEGVPPEYFMAQSFGAAVPHGRVDYHPAFDLCA
ncbi:GNAT family N-acetyltransferase [Uliginosibacterium gangwonense]|uniref:GNAT family N-acetyltransferase n=1 Tax=Uliginosibacterium gangwonense TaxID=392736 RepID=UPI0003625C77|nr:N-acetyltransferase [Uliginosibacterium gangwonense]